jgi:ElaB/YqjD/DUF883 family membrane-anchored ribosome-binding protein
MEQQAAGQSQPEGGEKGYQEVDLGNPREEFEALKQDYEALMADINNFFQAVKNANYGQKALDKSRDKIRAKPVAAIVGALAAGLILGRITRKH